MKSSRTELFKSRMQFIPCVTQFSWVYLWLPNWSTMITYAEIGGTKNYDGLSYSMCSIAITVIWICPFKSNKTRFFVGWMGTHTATYQYVSLLGNRQICSMHYCKASTWLLVCIHQAPGMYTCCKVLVYNAYACTHMYIASPKKIMRII